MSVNTPAAMAGMLTLIGTIGRLKEIDRTACGGEKHP
jgi:hypothetical protein